jgi:outer membrane protein TolC
MNSTACRPRLLAVALLTAAQPAWLAGCQSYKREGLDLAAHSSAFHARAVDAPEVLAFAASLTPAERSPGAALDPTDGVSSFEAEIVALVFNAELRLARLRANVVRATAENSGLWDDPTLGVDVVRIIQSTPEPWKLFATVGLTLPISGRLEIEKQKAGLDHAAELARVAQSEWNTRLAVRRAWTEWSALRAHAATTAEFLARIDQVLAVVERLEAAEEMARTEARLFRIERATRRSDLELLEARTEESALRLLQLMGLSPDAAIRLEAAGVGPAGREPGWEASVTRERIERGNPAVLVVTIEHEAAEKALELEVRRQYPDLQIGPGYGREDGQDQALLGLSLPVPVLNGNRRGIAEARARRELARATAETTLEQLLSAHRAAQLRLRAAMRQRASLETELVPLVDAQYADARHAAQLGEVNVLLLLETMTRQQEMKARLIAARREEALAEIELEALVGPAPAPSSAGPDAGHTDRNAP